MRALHGRLVEVVSALRGCSRRAAGAAGSAAPSTAAARGGAGGGRRRQAFALWLGLARHEPSLPDAADDGAAAARGVRPGAGRRRPRLARRRAACGGSPKLRRDAGRACHEPVGAADGKDVARTRAPRRARCGGCSPRSLPCDGDAGGRGGESAQHYFDAVVALTRHAVLYDDALALAAAADAATAAARPRPRRSTPARWRAS